MTHLLVQGKNDPEHEGTPQSGSLRDSSVNHVLIAIAQEVAELLKQAYPVQKDLHHDFNKGVLVWKKED